MADSRQPERARFGVALPDLGSMDALAGRLARVLRAGDVLALHGELGTGKTTLVRALAVSLGVDTEAVSSPTFVVVQEYEHPAGPGHPDLVHIDAYRLSGTDDLEALGWDRLGESGSGTETPPILAIEWADRIADGLPSVHGRVSLSHTDPGREAVVELPRFWLERDPGAFAARPGSGPGTGDDADADTADRGWATCPVTGVRVAPDTPTWPYANERARMADLERWFNGSYTITRPVEERDLEEGVD